MTTPIITINKPLDSFARQDVKIPGSKYLANRLLIISALAEGESILRNMPDNLDIEIAGQGVKDLGAVVNKSGSTWQVRGLNGRIKYPAKVYTGENGTFSRFGAALAALGEGRIDLDSAPRMKERPMENLIEALTKLGVKVEGEKFPLAITGPMSVGEVSLKGNVSSQYFSALTLTLPYAQADQRKESLIHITTPLVSKKYLHMTLELMKEFGVEARYEEGEKNRGNIIIPQGHYRGREYFLEADPVSATYFMGMAALAGKPLIIRGYNQHSLQGEIGFCRLLAEMGCGVTQVKEGDLEGIRISPSAHNLKGIEADMTDMPDAVPTLAVLASAAEGKTRITGIAHLRHKESNRVEDTASEISKAGIKVRTGSNFIEIEGGSPCPALFDSHNDHRLIMSLSLLCLRSREVKIKNYQAVEKSFPDYFIKLQELGFTLSY